MQVKIHDQDEYLDCFVLSLMDSCEGGATSFKCSNIFSLLFLYCCLYIALSFFSKWEANKSIFSSHSFHSQQLVPLSCLPPKCTKCHWLPCAMAFCCVCSLSLSRTEGLAVGGLRSPAVRRRACQGDQWIIQNFWLKINTQFLTSWFGVDPQSKWSNI